MTSSNDNTEPTDRQIDYARSLGIYIPFGITRAELSDLIENKNSKDKLASDRHKGFADFYNITYSQYVGKKTLFRKIQYELFGNNKTEDMASWFVFRVYRTLVRGQEDVSITSPDNQIIQEIASDLIKDSKFINSLKRYADSDLRYFGEFTDSNGTTHFGASKTTNAYKMTAAKLKEKLSIQEEIENGWNTPRKQSDDTYSLKIGISSTQNHKKFYEPQVEDISSRKSAFKDFEKKVEAITKNTDVKGKPKEPSKLIAYILLVLFGLIGGHRFYLGRKKSGSVFILIFLISLAFEKVILISWIWLIIDLFLIPKMIKNKESEWF
jgi:TM2 domain-containing membrane protein YozV